MLSVFQAEELIFNNLFRPGKERVAIEVSNGRVLAENISADRDLPPYNRVAMDGIAISFDAFQLGQRAFKIAGTLAAGSPPLDLVDPVCCIEVMTGAVLPPGTDTVIRYEDIAIKGGVATVNLNAVEQFQFVHRQGLDARKNDKLLEPGIKISPAEVALLASVGKMTVEVFKAPSVAIITTGDELVPIQATPEPWQVRRSNGYALSAALRSLGVESKLFHVRDELNELSSTIPRILQSHDLVILSGGVSKGKFDFIPQILEQHGIKRIFHVVNQRPGKPLWFGGNDRCTVFALPGSPVSTYLCFYRYIQPWIERSLGERSQRMFAVLGSDFTFQPNMTYFLQVKTEIKAGQLIAHPAPGGGSGDFVNLKNVDGFLELPEDKPTFKAGEAYPYIPFRT